MFTTELKTLAEWKLANPNAAPELVAEAEGFDYTVNRTPVVIKDNPFANAQPPNDAIIEKPKSRGVKGTIVDISTTQTSIAPDGSKKLYKMVILKTLQGEQEKYPVGIDFFTLNLTKDAEKFVIGNMITMQVDTNVAGKTQYWNKKTAKVETHLKSGDSIRSVVLFTKDESYAVRKEIDEEFTVRRAKSMTKILDGYADNPNAHLYAQMLGNALKPVGRSQE